MKINQWKADYDALARVRDYAEAQTRTGEPRPREVEVTIQVVPVSAQPDKRYRCLIRTWPDSDDEPFVSRHKHAYGPTLSTAINKALRSKWRKT